MIKCKKILSSILVFIMCFCAAFVVNAEGDAEEDAEGDAAVKNRIELASELGLENQVDEEGYLTDSFYEGKSDYELSNMGIGPLVDSLSSEELEAMVYRSKMGISLLTVTKYRKVVEGNDITGYFEVDGHFAFCIQFDKTTPAAGSPTSAPVLSKNDTLRKVLYYGYGGPEDMGYTWSKTALCASRANGHTQGTTYASTNVVWNAITAKPVPPNSFQVWTVHTNGSSTQDLAYWTYAPEVTATITKISSETGELLADAEFEHTLPNGSKEVLVTDANGKIAMNGLAKGVHSLKEIEAPAGYLVNENAVVFEVTEENKIKITSEVNEEFGKVTTETDEDGNLMIVVEDKVGFRLPETGGVEPICCLGSFICLGLLFAKRRKEV